VKSHGSADAYAFRHALSRAADAASKGLNDKIAGALGTESGVLRV
jgi:fatty acid/phospholipid biosynthesis enzyme